MADQQARETAVTETGESKLFFAILLFIWLAAIVWTVSVPRTRNLRTATQASGLATRGK
jgi:hypothetical protein